MIGRGYTLVRLKEQIGYYGSRSWRKHIARIERNNGHGCLECDDDAVRFDEETRKRPWWSADAALVFEEDAGVSY